MASKDEAKRMFVDGCEIQGCDGLFVSTRGFTTDGDVSFVARKGSRWLRVTQPMPSN